MSHEIHKTEGFVLGSRPIREADKYFYIYTRDFGLIGAVAQGVRKLNSKLRFHLQDFNQLDLELVEGKEIWRITSATKTPCRSGDGPHYGMGELGFLGNLFRLLRRLCPGEEKNEAVFNELKNVYQFLAIENLSSEELRNFECVVVLRLLNYLGYIGAGENVSIFVTSVLDKGVLTKASARRRALIEEINKSLKETPL